AATSDLVQSLNSRRRLRDRAERGGTRRWLSAHGRPPERLRSCPNTPPTGAAMECRLDVTQSGAARLRLRGIYDGGPASANRALAMAGSPQCLRYPKERRPGIGAVAASRRDVVQLAEVRLDAPKNHAARQRALQRHRTDARRFDELGEGRDDAP